jgi:hypothetical protein
MRYTALVATLVGGLLLVGCAAGGSVQRSVGGWIDQIRGRTVADGEARVSYAAVNRVKLLSEPDAASEVRGVLTLHEQIRRYQSEGGFAYVEAEGNLWGWVPESQLVERIPTARPPEAVEPAPAESVPAETTPTTEAPSEDVPPAPDAEPREPEGSVFDPY